jgi:hypothetical protein
MALPYGQISFQDFNSERGGVGQVSLNQEVSMTTAAYVFGVSYNTSGTDVLSMDEFWQAQTIFNVYSGCGYSNSDSGVCFDAASYPKFLWSNCGPFAFGVGCYVYLDMVPTPLTGYEYVQINGATWTINNSTGQITGLAYYQC